jgi:hypothetical protein
MSETFRTLRGAGGFLQTRHSTLTESGPVAACSLFGLRFAASCRWLNFWTNAEAQLNIPNDNFTGQDEDATLT